MTRYALRYQGSFEFLCVADTVDAFEKNVQAAFWAWKGTQARGNTKTVEDFLTFFDKVIVTVEKL